ncbi:MAG: Rieske 2Fe-2S domain-containing protein [Candidatus Eremiobacteraeota bacterium]|nr:Rieske 2Fe-2S domain-containing protein [Candidatus Eremiobacteraeota bacterium]
MLRSSYIHEDEQRHVFRVDRESMTSEEVFAAERDAIFAHCWLYLGHTSEVRATGDFVRREVAGQPLFFARGKDDRIRAFFNTCPHRGATVWRQDSGNAKAFQCFYHAWTFGLDGALTGMPDQAGYSEVFDRDEVGLREVARCEIYRGFIFVCFDENVVSLHDYLAGARDALDLIVDAADGAAEILGGTHEYGINANWKLLVENSIDGYHGLPVHETYFKYLTRIEQRATRENGTDDATPKTIVGRALDLGGGHAMVEYQAPWGRPIAKWSPLFGTPARAEIAAIREHLRAKHGEERAERMVGLNRNLLIFPNLVVNDIMAVVVRAIWPTSASRLLVRAWQLAPESETAGPRERRLEAFLTFLGPGGFATPDDVEALESCQAGFACSGVRWNDISRGMSREPQTVDEFQMRVFWRRWSQMMGGRVAIPA